ncbi:MAG TPA: peptidylprolyl isomerase [Kiloniellales bacterium]
MKYWAYGLALAAGLAGPGLAWAQSGAAAPAAAPAAGADTRTERLGAALDAMGKGNPVLARVDGHEIRFADVEASARDLPKDFQGRFETILPALLGRLIDRRLLVDAGRDAGLAEDPAVRRQVSEFEDRVVGEAFVERRVAATIDNDELRARYEAYRRRLADQAQVRARHILVSSREEALDIIAQLDKGADFAALARARSLAPTAAQGGDMDYFTRESMAPEFAELAFRLKVGQYSPAPLHTAFGWHVVKVEDRREEAPRSFFDMRDELRQAATQERLERMLVDLRRKAKIELFPEAPGSQ